MTPSHPIDRIHLLIDTILQRGPAPKVHFAKEAGLPVEASSPFAAHRFSVCLSESAKYVVLIKGQRSTVEVRRGEVIYALPRCLMESHPQGRYLSFGLVFQAGLIRFLLAKKRPQGGPGFSHRFLLTHHIHAALDGEGSAFLYALDRCAGEPKDLRYVQRLVELLLLKSQTLLHASQNTPGGKARLTWQAACQFVQEHIQEPLGRQDVADFLRVHPNHISRLFSQFGGESFHQYLHQARMERARLLMKNPALNLAEVAHACGFTDAGYFARCYRKHHGT